MSEDWKGLAEGLRHALGIQVPPIAITFHDTLPDVERFDAPMAPPAPDGRTGRVSAGCVFWIKFDTAHIRDGAGGSRQLQRRLAHAWNGDPGGRRRELRCGRPARVRLDHERPRATHSGGGDQPGCRDLRSPGRDASRSGRGPASADRAPADGAIRRLPGLRVEGKPQCHIVAIAKEKGEAAASVGCQLSRVRTGMANNEMTCALPAAQLVEVVARLQGTSAVDKIVAAYAAEDARRFTD